MEWVKYYTSYQIGPRLEEPSDNLTTIYHYLSTKKENKKNRGHISYFKVSSLSEHDEMT